MSGQDRGRIVVPVLVTLHAAEEDISPLAPWHEVDENVEDVSEVIRSIRVDPQEDRFQQAGEKAVEELPLLSL